MNELLYDGFELHEVVEYPQANKEGRDVPSDRMIWDAEHTPRDRIMAKSAGGRFSWAVYGHQPDGKVKLLMTGGDREELSTLCEFLNYLVEMARAGEAAMAAEGKPVQAYGVSVYLEEGPDQDTMDINEGVTFFWTTKKEDAESAFKYAQDVLSAGLPHLKISARKFEEEDEQERG